MTSPTVITVIAVDDGMMPVMIVPAETPSSGLPAIFASGAHPVHREGLDSPVRELQAEKEEAQASWRGDRRGGLLVVWETACRLGMTPGKMAW